MLEKIIYDKENKEVIITIDFCYWQQKNYTDDMQETGIITLIFSDVSGYDYTPFEIDSDEIISVQNNSENELYFEFCNDITEECHSLRIEAKQVKMFADNERN